MKRGFSFPLTAQAQLHTQGEDAREHDGVEEPHGDMLHIAKFHVPALKSNSRRIGTHCSAFKPPCFPCVRDAKTGAYHISFRFLLNSTMTCEKAKTIGLKKFDAF